jgi:hypothetical protein
MPLTKYQTIAYLSNDSDQLPFLPPILHHLLIVGLVNPNLLRTLGNYLYPMSVFTFLGVTGYLQSVYMILYH